MNDSFCAVLRSTPCLLSRLLPRAACLLALAASLAGCGPGQDEPLLPYTHGAGAAADQFLNATPSDLRHQQRLGHAAQSRRHIPTVQPQEPVALN